MSAAQPAPGETRQFGDERVEHRRCSCCKDGPSRFFVYRGTEIVAMATDWDALAGARGWSGHGAPGPAPARPQCSADPVPAHPECSPNPAPDRPQPSRDPAPARPEAKAYKLSLFD